MDLAYLSKPCPDGFLGDVLRKWVFCTEETFMSCYEKDLLLLRTVYALWLV